LNVTHNKWGFSLIEVVVTIAILAILSAIAIPSMIGWRGERQLRGAINSLLGDFQLARTKAIRNSDVVAVSFDTATKSYLVFRDENENGVLDAGEEQYRSVNLPSNIEIDSVSFSGGDPWASYDPRGIPKKFGSLTLSNSNGSTLKIIMNRVGRLRIE
jgi:type IV fimbrial biogenesis protein FimT